MTQLMNASFFASFRADSWSCELSLALSGPSWPLLAYPDSSWLLLAPPGPLLGSSWLLLPGSTFKGVLMYLQAGQSLRVTCSQDPCRTRGDALRIFTDGGGRVLKAVSLFFEGFGGIPL